MWDQLKCAFCFESILVLFGAKIRAMWIDVSPNDLLCSFSLRIAATWRCTVKDFEFFSRPDFCILSLVKLGLQPFMIAQCSLGYWKKQLTPLTRWNRQSSSNGHNSQIWRAVEARYCRHSKYTSHWVPVCRRWSVNRCHWDLCLLSWPSSRNLSQQHPVPVLPSNQRYADSWRKVAWTPFLH